MGKSRKQATRKPEPHVRGRAGTQAELRLAAIVESSEDAIIGKDLNEIITDWNNGAERLYGYSADEVIGKPISLLLPPDRTNELAEIMRRIRGGEVVKHFETVRQRKDGTRIEVSLTISPIRDSEDQIIGASAIARDISERKRAEEALHQKDRELSEAQRLARVGSWYCDFQNDTVTWSEELYRISGRDPKLPAPNHKKHPEIFTAASWERLQPAIDGALRDGTSYELDIEMVRPDGTTRWVRAHGEAVCDNTDRIVALRGTAQDMTERKLSEEALAGMSRKLLEAQEQERARIARELHDDISQQLALLSAGIQQVKEIPSASAGELQSRLDQLEKQAWGIAAGVQSLSHELHSSRLEYLGIVPAIQGFCKEFGDKHKVKVAFDSEGVLPAVPQDVSLCLLRVMQEGLHNALKHSGVRSYAVKLQGSPTEIHLTVRDSGVGFDPELINDAPGLGLVSMKERVKLVKGTISITSKPQSGTEINIGVPLSAGRQTEKTKLAGA